MVVCVFSQLQRGNNDGSGNGEYEIAVLDDTGSCVGTFVKPLLPFLHESRLIKLKHGSNPPSFSLGKQDIPKDAWEVFSAPMMIRFIHFVEHPHLQTSISSMEIELAALNSKLHSALTKIKDACLEKEQTLNDEIVQIRKKLISLQIQSIAGGESQVEDLRQQITQAAARVINIVPSSSPAPRSHLSPAPMLSGSDQGINVSALSGNVAFLSQLRHQANDKLKTFHQNEKERVENEHQQQAQQLTSKIQINTELAKSIGFVEDQHQMAKMCVFATAVDAPKFLEECMVYVSKHFPNVDKNWFLSPSNASYNVLITSALPSSRSPSSSSASSSSSTYSLPAMPNGNANPTPFLSHPSPLSHSSESQTPKQLPPTQHVSNFLPSTLFPAQDNLYAHPIASLSHSVTQQIPSNVLPTINIVEPNSTRTLPQNDSESSQKPNQLQQRLQQLREIMLLRSSQSQKQPDLAHSAAPSPHVTSASILSKSSLPTTNPFVPKAENQAPSAKSDTTTIVRDSDAIIQSLRQNYKLNKNENNNLAPNVGATSDSAEQPHHEKRPASPSTYHTRLQSILQTHLTKPSVLFSTTLSQSPQPQQLDRKLITTDSQNGTPSEFILNLLKEYEAKKRSITGNFEVPKPATTPQQHGLQHENRELMLARMRAETKKTFELNNKYRETIRKAIDVEEDPTTQSNHGDGDGEDEMTLQRRMLQAQQEQQYNTIRRAWGTESENDSLADQEAHASEHAHKQKRHPSHSNDSRSRTSTPSPRRVRFGSSLSVTSSSASGSEGEFTDSDEETSGYSPQSSLKSISSADRDLLVKEGLKRARARSHEISIILAQQKTQKAEEMKLKKQKADKVKRLVDSISEMAKDQVVKRARQKNTDTTVQDIGPTQEQLEQLAKQEETMRARALERMRTSQAKMAQLRLRDESEKKKKEQDKWEKRDEKLRKFLDHQRALLLQESADTLALPPSLPFDLIPPAPHPSTVKPRASSAPRSSVQFAPAEATANPKSRPTRPTSASRAVPAPVTVPPTTEPKFSQLNRIKHPQSNLNTDHSVNHQSIHQNRSMPPNHTPHMQAGQPPVNIQSNQPSKLLQPNFLMRKRATSLTDANSNSNAPTNITKPPPAILKTQPFTKSAQPTTTSALKPPTKPPIHSQPPPAKPTTIIAFGKTTVVQPTQSPRPEPREKPPQPQPRPAQPPQPLPTHAPTPTPTPTTQPAPHHPQPRIRHPSLTTIAMKREGRTNSSPALKPNPTNPSAIPTNHANHRHSTPSNHMTTPQREKHETAVFQEIERAINQQEKAKLRKEDEDILSSVENDLFGHFSSP